MKESILLLSLSIVVLAETVLNATNLPASPQYQGITLNSSGYVFPLTSFPTKQEYYYNFELSPGYYAHLDLHAYNLVTSDLIYISSSLKYGVYQVHNTHIQPGLNNFTNSQTWVDSFKVILITHGNEKLQMEFKIAVFKQTPEANIVKTYEMLPDSSSVFLYNDQLKEGDSYQFTSKSGKIYAAVATYMDIGYKHLNEEWKNVLVYDDGTLKRPMPISLRRKSGTISYSHYISTSRKLILYCTKNISAPGAIMITDYSNVEGVNHTLQYVPVFSSFDVSLNSTYRVSAFTLVTNRESTTMIPEKISTKTGKGEWSYVVGGPIKTRSNAADVSVKRRDKKINGNVNTFYLPSGCSDLSLALDLNKDDD